MKSYIYFTVFIVLQFNAVLFSYQKNCLADPIKETQNTTDQRMTEAPQLVTPPVNNSLENIKATMIFPAYHPMSQLKRGEIKEHDGVVFFHSPGMSDRQTIYTTKEENISLSESEKWHQQLSLRSEQYALLYKKNLTPKAQAQLSDLHINLMEKHELNNKQIIKKEINYTDTIDTLVDMIIEFEKSKYKIFSDKNNLISNNSNDINIINENEKIKSKLKYFLSGEYLKNNPSSTSKKINVIDDGATGHAPFLYELDPSKTHIDQNRGKIIPMSSDANDDIKIKYSEPELIGFGFRVYTAEHDIDETVKNDECSKKPWSLTYT